MKRKKNIKALAARHMEHICLSKPPNTVTELAESTAIDMHNDQWLDDSNHWIWELALQKYEEFYDYYFNPADHRSYSKL